ncbi:MAG TPA: hypothetical protein DCP20_09160, partial [Coriobacteriia bacterium]|nr:hypothetical protein [Coriobacteriia bacterium]
TTTAGAGATYATWGVAAEVSASEPGTYTLACDVTDATGALVAQPAESAVLSVETTTLVAWVEGAELSGVAEGALTVSRVRLTRETEDGDLLADATDGFTTASYIPSDFEAFCISMPALSPDPSPTSTIIFSGTAVYTPATVSLVEYSLDAGASWTPAVASDGAFDEAFEDFEIALDLADGAYGLLVRCAGSDEATMPAAAWAGDRFIVDTVAPAAPTGVGAMPAIEGVSVSWDPSEPSTLTAAAVYYEVEVDDVPVTSTYGTSVLLNEVDSGPHSIRVVPVDEAGNRGEAAVLLIDETPPVTLRVAAPSSPDGDDGWHVTTPEITLSANEPATTYYAWDEADLSVYDVPLSAPEGIHTLSYLSVDVAENREDTATATFKVDTIAPGAPSSLEAAVGGTDSIDLSWSAATDDGSGLSAYLVYLADDTYLGETSALTYTADGLDPDTAYSFYV